MRKGDYIPDYIVVDILSKLPPRSVLRFKIACKTWYSLLFDHVFLNSYNIRTKRLSHQNPKSILISTVGPSETQLQLLNYESRPFDVSSLSDAMIKFSVETTVAGSSCGLLCIAATKSFGYNFYILNPLTRECRKLPKCRKSDIKPFPNRLNWEPDELKGNKPYFHRLGYDSVADDFKFVISTNTIIWKFFSLKATSNSWRRIKWKFHPDYFKGPNDMVKPEGNNLATSVGMTLYWLGGQTCVYLPSDCRPTNTVIIGFNVANETVETLYFPSYMSKRFCRSANLLEHRGYLCASYVDHDRHPCPLMSIMMMKKYGSWVGLCTIYVASPYDEISYRSPIICMSTRDEVVFHTTSNKLTKFKLGRKNVGVQDEIITQHLDVAGLYVESLISPNCP